MFWLGATSNIFSNSIVPSPPHNRGFTFKECEKEKTLEDQTNCEDVLCDEPNENNEKLCGENFLEPIIHQTLAKIFYQKKFPLTAVQCENGEIKSGQNVICPEGGEPFTLHCESGDIVTNFGDAECPKED